MVTCQLPHTQLRTKIVVIMNYDYYETALLFVVYIALVQETYTVHLLPNDHKRFTQLYIAIKR